MKLFWSPSAGGFFDEAIHGERLVLVVDEERMADLDAAAASGEGESGDDMVDRDEIALDPPRKWIANAACIIPADAIEISSAEHEAMMGEVAAGKRIVSDEHGRPVAVEPVQTVEEALAALRQRRDRDLAATDWTQLPDALTAAKRKLWKDHRDALRDLPKLVQGAIDAGKPIDSVSYPEAPS